MSKMTNFFYENTSRIPEKIAIWCDGKTATYSEMGNMVSGIANMLLENGVKPGDRIGVPMNNSIESVALFFAAAEIGAAMAPINPTLPAAAIETAFDSVGVSCVIARRSFLRHFEARSKVCFCLDSDQIPGTIPFDSWKQYSMKRPGLEVAEDATLILTLTSGSTGDPKPIELSQKNKIDRAFAHVDLYGLSEDDRVMAATPLYHSLAERLVIMPLLIGATSVLLPRFTPDMWLNCIAQQQVTFTIAVSAQLAQVSALLSDPDLPDITSLHTLVSSSALLELPVKQVLIDKLRCQFHEMYGASEISTATDINFTQVGNKTKTVGYPLKEAQLRIVDENRKEVPVGQIGEIAVKSSLAFKGYYRLPEKTAEAYSEDGYFHTGDLGRVDEDGYLYFCGRKKEIIITGGINVYPQDIEESLKKLSGVSECAAFPYPDERLGEIVAIAIVKESGSDLTTRAVQFYCARNLADFQQPHKIFFMDQLPKNAMGKLTKGKIYEVVKREGLDND